jgi:uncharacterized oxidoreductase
VAHNKQVKVPPDSLLDRHGAFTDDPSVMFPPAGTAQGALVPFAGHKGHALAMVCELLGAALTGGETTRPGNIEVKYAIWNNMLTIVFDPQRMGGSNQFSDEVGAFVEWVKSSPLRNPADPVMMPGEPEQSCREKRAHFIDIDGGTLAQLDAAAAAVHEKRGASPGPLSAVVTP